ncbi:MAG: AMP-binding protein, partial [Planctomycetales bacterium]
IHTPYGATEALPVASKSSQEVLNETQEKTDVGAGVCVGKRFGEIDWKVVRIVDGPVRTISETEEEPPGTIGELIVTGPVVTDQYVTRIESNMLSKIADGARVWHRMGDVGYLDEAQRFWFCGRMSHRIQAATKTLYTVPCESIFNTHPAVYRSALIGIGRPGAQRPLLVVEPFQYPDSSQKTTTLLCELQEIGQQNDRTRSIQDFLLHRSLPVDIRHNAKIFREKLVPWAEKRCGKRTAR